MSSPPLSKPRHRAGFLERPVRSSAGSRWPQALAQIRKQFLARSFVLAAGPSCRGPRQLVASELAVVPSATPGSPSSNAWPARPRHALSRHISCPTQLRALHRVPSGAGVRACLPGSRLRASTGSVIPLKIGSEVPIGPRFRGLIGFVPFFGAEVDDFVESLATVGHGKSHSR
jgi:hypothetical protein